jgi:hypothetical protein
MANRTAFYFLAPTWDFPPPPIGPVHLGAVITSVKTPEKPLHTGPEDEREAFGSEQRQVAYSLESFRSGEFGIFTRFMSMVLGVGVDATLGFEKSDASLFEFESLETVQFQPTPSYLKTCISADPVQRFLKTTRYRKPIYIVTGLKIAKGAKAKSRNKTTRRAGAAIEADAAPWTGVPVGGGPEVSATKAKAKDVAWDGGSDFVFAFRVRKVVVKRSNDVGSETDYTKGALLDGESERLKEPELLAVEVEDHEENYSDNFSVEQLMDGGELVSCLVPKVDAEE